MQQRKLPIALNERYSEGLKSLKNLIDHYLAFQTAREKITKKAYNSPELSEILVFQLLVNALPMEVDTIFNIGTQVVRTNKN